MNATRRRTILWLGAGTAGFLLFAVTFARTDRLSRVGFALDRATAVERSREVASRFGLDVTGWRGVCSSEDDGSVLRQTSGRDPAATPGELMGIGAIVRFVGPASEGRVTISLDARGGVVGIYAERPGTAGAPDDAQVTALGTAWLRSLAGSEAAAYEETRRSAERGAVRIRWTRRGDPDRTAEAIVVRASEPRIHLASVLDPLSVKVNLPSQIAAIVRGLLCLALTLGALALGTAALVQRQARARWIVAGGLPIVLAGGILVLLGPAILFVAWKPLAQSAATIETMGWIGEHAVVPLFQALVCGLAWAAGRGLLSRGDRRAALAVDDLLRLRISTRSAARAVLAGVAAGAVIGLVPIGMALLARGSLVLRHEHEAFLFARLPMLAALSHVVGRALWDGLPVFGLAAPFLAQRFPRPALATSLTAILGTAWFGTAGFFGPWEKMAGLVAGAAVTGLLFALWRRFGLAAVLAATFTSQLAAAAATLAVPPSGATRGAALGLLAVLVFVAGRAAVAAERGAEDEDETAGAPVVSGPAAGDQLRAEMDLARAIQERLLRRNAADPPGFSVSSVCRPAQDVGGDLYAILPLPEGCFVVAVADVAGKGLPAALVMTLSKGLLLGATEESSNGREIASILNAGIRASCDRKTFVTATIGVLDPAARTVSLVRAGHTASVVCRAATGEAELCGPPGIALGVTSREAFDAATGVETVSLGPGDALVLYSDGVTEAMDVASKEYGEERLVAAVRTAPGQDLSADGIRDAILADVETFVAGAPQHDDLTLVVLKASR